MNNQGSGPSLNLGRFSIRVPDESSELRVGTFWKRRQNDSSSQSERDSDSLDQDQKRLAMQVKDQDRPFRYPRGSTASRSESVESDSTTITSRLTDEASSNLSSTENDRVKVIDNNPNSHNDQNSNLDATPILYINTQRSSETTGEDDDTHESIVINVNPNDYGTSQVDSASCEDRDNLGGLGQFTCDTQNIPKAMRKKVYPKQLPYNKIMSHVTFVMSGYENPRRGKLRDMAIAMGAKYQPNWTRFSTHLICAFKNTPKYKDVMAENGRIVREHWIQECSRQRQLLDWRNYMLGKYPYPDSEEEVDVDDLDYVLETAYGIKRPAS